MVAVYWGTVWIGRHVLHLPTVYKMRQLESTGAWGPWYVVPASIATNRPAGQENPADYWVQRCVPTWAVRKSP